jgi:DNA (cytosine-5)-methyltransferase 1
VSVYYNERDGYAAGWLRNLVARGHIAPGDVDERDIVDVRADDLLGYLQCHFFAGIGGWSYALRLTGWPDERPVWTGSCPCQPFSAAGKGTAADDGRHLWPAWFSLIRECRPAVVFGEQVEAAIGWGWLDVVFADLEAQGYACGAAVLPACGVGAPHIRQRVWFVADADAAGRCELGGGGILDGERSSQRHDADGCGELGHASGERLEERLRHDGGGNGLAPQTGKGGPAPQRPGASPWADCQWLACIDGKGRPVEPGTFPLAHGLPGRVGRLRAYGNAIVPQVAAEFIRAMMP